MKVRLVRVIDLHCMRRLRGIPTHPLVLLAKDPSHRWMDANLITQRRVPPILGKHPADQRAYVSHVQLVGVEADAQCPPRGPDGFGEQLRGPEEHPHGLVHDAHRREGAARSVFQCRCDRKDVASANRRGDEHRRPEIARPERVRRQQHGPLLHQVVNSGLEHRRRLGAETGSVRHGEHVCGPPRSAQRVAGLSKCLRVGAFAQENGQLIGT